MRVGLHKRPFLGYVPFMRRFEVILDYNGIEHIRVDISKPDFWKQVAELDLFIFWWGHAYNDRELAFTILPIIENEMKMPCLPNLRTCWMYDDKIREYYLMKQHGLPIVPCWIFWDKKEAIKWVENASFPAVFKLRGGAGSQNVVLVKSKYRARKLINKMFGPGMKSGKVPWGSPRWKDFNLQKIIRSWGGNFLRRIRAGNVSPGWELHKNYVLFQKFLPYNDFDTRVTVIGERAFAFRRHNRTQDFRSSGSGRIDYDVEAIDKKFLEKSFEISRAMHFQSMAYDGLYDENMDVNFCEISYTYLDTAIYNCQGYWDEKLNWHEGHYWPQYFQLMDALKMPDLKQPEIEYFHERGL